MQKASASGNTWKRLKVPRAKNEKWVIWKNVERHRQLWPVKHEGEEWQDVYSCHLVPSLTAGRRLSDLSFPQKKPPFSDLTFIYFKLIFILDLPFLLCTERSCPLWISLDLTMWAANLMKIIKWISVEFATPPSFTYTYTPVTTRETRGHDLSLAAEKLESERINFVSA